MSLNRLIHIGYSYSDAPCILLFVDEGANLVNHEGVALINRDDLPITKRDLKLRFASFEYLCGYVTVENSHVLILDVYLPGSVEETSEGLKDLTAVLDVLALTKC